MRAAFVNDLYGTFGSAAVNAPAFTDKVAKYGLQGLAFPANASATPDDMAILRARGISVWSMRDPHWDGLGPVSLARQQLADLATYAPNHESLTLCADIEYPVHDPNYIIAWYLSLRPKIEPWRRIIWTLEGHQGGWFSPDLVALINADPNWLILPQQYENGTTDWGTVDWVRADITSRGVNGAQVRIVRRGGELSPTSFPDGAAYTLDEGAPWGLP